MITIPKYKIPNFQDVRSGYDFKGRNDLKYASYIACLYYEFAYYQMLGFSDTYDNFFRENPNDHNIVDSYLNKCWSEAYAMYALLRTTIEATRKINKELLDQNEIDPYYRNKIKMIVDITNDIVKHPMFNDPVNASKAYRPVSIDIGGEIDVEIWIDEVTPSSTLLITPMRDFEAVQAYLEHVADLLNKKLNGGN